MPANWGSFISNVSNKLSGQSIQGSYDPQGKDVDDFATFLANQYVLAISGKAQTPFGNLHQKGNTQLITSAFTKAFKLLEEERSPTLADKLKDPKYEDLKEPIPTVNTDEYLDKFDLEFLAWAELNGATIPDFTYSLFFSQFPNFPTTRSQQVLEIARRIVQKYDGTPDYMEWIDLIGSDPTYSDLTKDVIDKVGEIIKIIRITTQSRLEDFKNLANVNISKELFQEEHINDPARIPDYMVRDFIIKFTYDKNYDSISYRQIYSGRGISFFLQIREAKAAAYGEEAKRFVDLKQRYTQELADAEKKASEKNDANDPYIIMAAGILAYWASTLQQPFSAAPPVPPCIIPAPLGGFFIPISYGSRKRLADYLRRAFNTGKIFKTIPERRISATAVATALAFSFAANMLEFKLIYSGGIPTPTGPVPMVGFVPIAF